MSSTTDDGGGASPPSPSPGPLPPPRWRDRIKIFRDESGKWVLWISGIIALILTIVGLIASSSQSPKDAVVEHLESAEEGVPSPILSTPTLSGSTQECPGAGCGGKNPMQFNGICLEDAQIVSSDVVAVSDGTILSYTKVWHSSLCDSAWLQVENVKNTNRKIEISFTYNGQSITAKEESIASLSTNMLIGPADSCYSGTVFVGSLQSTHTWRKVLRNCN